MSKNTTLSKDLVSKLKSIWGNNLVRSLILMGIVVLSVLAFRTVLVIALKTDYPLETPVSTSMIPTLNKGDLLIVQGIYSADEINAAPRPVGDIIVFRKPIMTINGTQPSPNELVVHRAIDKFEIGGVWYFITKGDNNTIQDYWYGFPRESRGGIPESYIIGKVVGVIPLLGNIKIYLGTPIGIVVSILLIAALLFIENLSPSEEGRESKSSQAKTEKQISESDQ